MAQHQQTTALITESVSNLIGGVSQQADAVRQPTQATEILNALLSPTEGLKKRPPSQYLQNVTALFGSPSTDLDPDSLFTHMYNRDSAEKYIVMIVDGDLRVYSLVDGSLKTVTFPDGKAYLAADSPGTDFRAVTVGDYTFIVNRTVEVLDLAAVSPAAVFEALVWARVGDYGVDYSIVLDGTTHKISTDLTHRDEVTTDYIAGALFAKIPSGKGVGLFTLGTGYAVGNTITVTRTSTGGGSFVYTVKVGVDGNVESLHDIARGVTDLINQGSLATTGHIFAFPVATDDTYAMTDGFVISNITTGEVYTWSITTSGAASPSVSNVSQANTYTLVKNGSTLYVKRVDSADFTISAHDGLGDQSIRAIKGQIQRFADLPARAVDGFRIEVTGEARTDTDNFYVIYEDSSAAMTDGVWKESLKGGEKIALDPATMPWVLIRQGDGTFIFEQADWDTRLAGNLDNAPFPSFLHKTLSEVFLFKNRLGLIAEENVILSSTGNYFNFFRLSVQQLLDEDIIDIAPDSTEIALVQFAVPHETAMTLWAAKQQFELSAGDPKNLLTAKTVIAPPSTAFENSVDVKPVKVGKDIFFCDDRGSATKLLEFTGRDAEDITAIVPSYCVGQPLKVTGSEKMGLIVLATKSNTNDIYPYTFVWLGDSLAQSAWSTWKFGNDGNVLAVQFMENRLILVIQRGTVVLLEYIEIRPADTDASQAHLTYLDLRMTDGTPGLSSAYDGLTGKTTWTLPFDIPEDADYPLKVARRAGALTTEFSGITRPGNNKIACSGDQTGAAVFIGLAYDFEAELSKLYAREQSQDGRISAITDAVTQVRKVELKYDKTGYFVVEVTPDGRSTPYSYVLDDSTNIGEGTFEVPVLSNNERVSIVIRNSSHRPCAFQGMAWTAMVSQKTKR